MAEDEDGDDDYGKELNVNHFTEQILFQEKKY